MADPPGIPSRNRRPEPPPAPAELEPAPMLALPPWVPAAPSPEPAGSVTVGKGITMPSVVALALIASVGGFATAWLNKPSPGDPAELMKAWRNEAAAQKAERALVDAQILKRLDGAETKLDRLQDSQDRLRERVNERFAEPR